MEKLLYIIAIRLLCLSQLQLNALAYYEICRQRPIDVVFLLDGSRSVHIRNFQVIKDYVKNFTNVFDQIGPNDVQVGIVQFGSIIREEIRLNQYNSRQSLLRAIDNITYMKTGTMTGEALKYLVTDALAPSHGARINNSHVHEIAVVITDGKSQDYHRGTLTRWQRKAKERGVELFAIGVGKKTKDKELLEIASEIKYNHKFHAQDFASIRKIHLSLDHLQLCYEDLCRNEEKNDCQQICINTINSFSCQCEDGFMLHDDEKSCISNDPCFEASCSHLCYALDTFEYECQCPPLMRLDGNRIDCIDTQPILSNLKITDITHTSSQVLWEVDDIGDGTVDHYLVIYQKDEEFDEPTPVEIYVGTTAANLTNLEPSTRYVVSVVANTPVESSHSVKGAFTTLSLGETALTLESSTFTTITARWTPAGGQGLTGYEVTYQEAMDNIGEESSVTAVTKQYEADIHEVLLSNLKPATNYFVSVAPVYAELTASPATDEKETAQLVAPDITVINTTLSQLSAEWNLANFEPDTWTVEIFSPLSGELKTVKIRGKQLQTIFKNLEPATQYELEVTANLSINENNFVTPKGKAYGRTQSLIPPEVSVASTTESSMSIEWSPMNILADSWLVRVFPKGKNKFFKVLEVDGNTTSVICDGLLPSTLYKVEVEGRVMEDGNIFQSPMGKVSTETKSLLEPSVGFTNQGFESLTAQWNNMSSNVDMWTVSLYENGNTEPVQRYEIDGHKTSVDFLELQQGIGYDVEVIGHINGYYADFNSLPGKASSITKSLSAPSVECISTSLSTATVQWSNINATLDYWAVKVYDGNGEEYIQIFNQSSDEREIILNHLHPSTSYTVEVVGNVIEGNTTCYSLKGKDSFTTSSLLGPTVEITNQGFASMRAEWEDINAEVDSWTVFLYEDENNRASQSFNVDGHQTSIDFFGLQQGKGYSVEVVGHVERNNFTYDSPAGTVTGTTNILSVPSVECTATTLSTAIVEWSNINATVDYWSVKVYADGTENDMQIFNQSSDQRQIILEHLHPSTSYIVEVVGNVMEGNVICSSLQGQDTFTTNSLLQPNVEITNRGVASFTAGWDDFKAEIESWTVYLYVKGNREAIQRYQIDGKENSIDFYGIQQGLPYRVEVIGHVNEREVAFNSPTGMAWYITELISAPTVECIATTATTAIVEWSNINTTVDYWTVKIYDKDERKYVKIYNQSSGQREIILKQLHPSTPYTVEVVGNVIEGNVTSNGPIGHDSFITKPFLSPAVEIINTGFESLQVKWENENTEVDSWTVYLYAYGIDEAIQKYDIDGDEMSIHFSGLQQGLNYKVEVIGHIDGYYVTFDSTAGSASDITYELPAPSVECVGTRVSTATVQWSNINATVDYWTVKVYGDNEEDVKIFNQSSDQREIIFDHLHPSTSYTVEVVGNVIEGNVTCSSRIGHDTFTTKPFLPPTVAITSTGLVSLAAEWDNENMDVDSWTVYLYAYGSDEAIQRYDFGGNETSTIISGLQQGTGYKVEVIGHIDVYQSLFDSLPGTASDITHILPAPSVECTANTASTATVKWSNINATVDYWTVKVYADDGAENMKIFNQSSDQREIMLKQLRPSTSYTVEVVGNVMEENIACSSLIGHDSFTTYSLQPPVVRITKAGFTTLKAEWGDINGDVNSWTVTLYVNGNNVTDQVYNIDGELNALEFTGLKQGTIYRVHVVGHYNRDLVVFDSPLGRASSTTNSLSVPIVECIDTTVSTATVKWSNVNATVDYWTIKVYADGKEKHAEIFNQPGNDRLITLQQLRPATVFNVEVFGTILERNIAVNSSVGNETFVTKPTPPRNIKVIQREFANLIVAFDPSYSTVDSYNGACISVGGKVTKGSITPDLVMHCSNLEPATLYDIYVSSLYRNLESEKIFASNATLTPLPTGLTISNITTHTMLAEWQPPDTDSGIDYYIVSYNSSYGEIMRVVDTNQTTLLFTDLEPGTLYDIQLHTVVNGETRRSDFASEATLYEAIPLQVDYIDHTTINISWIPSIVPHLQTYLFGYRPSDNTDIENDIVISPNISFYTLTGLQPATRYRISIIARYRAGQSESSDIFASTLAFPPVQPLRFSDVTKDSFVVNWMQPESNVKPLCYVVTYKKPGMKTVTIENVATTYLRIEELDTVSLYNITVSTRYPNDVTSNPISGTATTLQPDDGSCSCITYLRTQSQMQFAMLDLVQQIDVMNMKMENASSSNSNVEWSNDVIYLSA